MSVKWYFLIAVIILSIACALLIRQCAAERALRQAGEAQLEAELARHNSQVALIHEACELQASELETLCERRVLRAGEECAARLDGAALEEELSSNAEALIEALRGLLEHEWAIK